MPISAYFKGKGEQVMADMKSRYGGEKGERVFYATANKQGEKPKGLRGYKRRGETMAKLLLVGMLLLGKKVDFPIPASLDGYQTAGCSLLQTSPEPGTLWWHTRVWIQFKDHKWERLFSIRPGDERWKAFRDCDQWLSHLSKVVHRSPTK